MCHPERTILEILGGQQQSAQYFIIRHIQAPARKLHYNYKQKMKRTIKLFIGHGGPHSVMCV